MTDPTESTIAGAKLQELMEHPDVEIKRLPDGGVRVGKFISLWKRITSSVVLWVNTIAGVLAAAWLSLPQETIMALIPVKYAAWGMIGYAVINVLARMRTL